MAMFLYKKPPNTTEQCMSLPPKVNSEGIWTYLDSHDPWMILKSALPAVQLEMSLIFVMTLAFHLFLGRIGISKFTSQVLTGLIIGTSFNETWKEKRNFLFHLESQDVLGLISVFGYSLFLFLVGVKTDMSMIHRTGRKAMNIGVVATLTPFLFAVAFKYILATRYPLDQSHRAQLPYLIAMLSLTPFPVISSVLSELKILNSELGRLALSSAIVSDMFSIFMTCISGLSEIWVSGNKVKAVLDLAGMFFYVFVVVFLLRPAMYWVVKRTPEGSRVNENYIFFIVLCVLLSAYLSNVLDQYALFGPYILGLAVPEGPPLGSAIIDKFDTFVSGVFIPLFVTTCAMRVDLDELMKWDNFTLTVTILAVVTSFAKLVACMLPPLYCRMPLRDAMALTVIMSCKGIVELGGYTFFRDRKTISDNVFALLAIIVLINSTITPLLVKILYDPSRKYAGYMKRNVTDLKDHAELRLLVCIIRPDNIPSMVNLLEVSCPTRDYPLGVYVLQLIELIGRASPVFISHQMQKKTIASHSCSEKVLVAFGHFEREYWGSAVVNIFTAVSPQRMMHEDICTMALDKLTSLIILPFHRKWSEDGTQIELDDSSTRALNCSVLERAPCSVGIIVDRGQSHLPLSTETPNRICMIFLGGEDDREALTLAKRMARDSHMSLTVIRFLAPKDQIADEKWDERVDSTVLNDVMNNSVGDAYVTYIEEIVRDGPQTALIIRSFVEEYDLIVVGRRYGINSHQTSGLLEWSEFPELGVLGDLLASTDMTCNASVLVVQQQRVAR
ncbi:Cation/H(+) antiporter like [Quillaja saponaria]|uniref:Cation/H(+) antiporter like n=1 Tax=Quillaja saponaria TaxID=32244 RepID=A0AAD7PRM3_QUISA|nr:Cation/H(+) antiporter like [Quillaja saponaria]